MDLRQLECVVAVARHEHVTRAADALHLTQSAVSQHVLRLEAELGVRLFDRSARGTTPTAAGVELLARAETILAAVGSARTAMAAHGDGARATVRVLAAPGEVPGLTGALVALAGGTRPELGDGAAGSAPGHGAAGEGPARAAPELVAAPSRAPLALRHAGAGAVVDGVRQGAADLGLCALDGPAPGGLDVVPLAPDPLVILTGGGAAAGATLAGLRERPVLLPAAGTAARAAAAAAFAATGFSPLPRFDVADAATACAIVAAGLAAAVVPASWAAADPALTATPLGADAAPVRPVLLHRPGLSPAAAALAAALTAALGLPAA